LIDIPAWISPYDNHSPFPDAELALKEPDGLLAVGGNLSPERLLTAYQQGVFPWYSADQPILWWSPNPRLVMFPEKLKVTRSLRKTLRKYPFTITFDHAFEQVIAACSQSRPNQEGTWLTPEMMNAYCQLHRLGFAHSVEAWKNQQLVGGLYGVVLGKIFFGESMFSQVTDASKTAFVYLVTQLRAWQFQLIDCQVKTEHLMRFGAEQIPRSELISYIKTSGPLKPPSGSWSFAINPVW